MQLPFTYETSIALATQFLIWFAWKAMIMYTKEIIIGFGEKINTFSQSANNVREKNMFFHILTYFFCLEFLFQIKIKFKLRYCKGF